MKFRLLAGVAFATIMVAGSAFAADMPMKAAPIEAPYDWSGIYIGGVIGGAWANNDISDPGCGVCALFGVPGAVLGVPAVQTTSSSGFIGGIEGGDRYQFGKLVIGWEADVTWGDMNGTSTSSFGLPAIVGPGVALNESITANTKWTATAVSTIGIAHDRWLVYGKAGVAWAHTDYTDNWTVTGVPGITSLFGGLGNDNNNRAGWTVGTGVEWAIWNNWSVKAEYDYLDFGTRTVAINGTLPTVGIGISDGLQNTNHINQFKAGLNWHIMPNIW